MLRNWFSDPEDTNPSFIQMTRNILIFTIIVNAASLAVVSGIEISNLALAVTASGVVLEIIALLALYLRRSVIMAKTIVPIALIVIISYNAIIADGIHDVSMVALPFVAAISALLLRRRAFTFITPLLVIAALVIAYADFAGINKSIMAKETGYGEALLVPIFLIGTSYILNLLIERFTIALSETRKSEEILTETNKKLLELQGSLENRVSERTSELDLANQRNEHRAKQFKSIAQVARATIFIQNLEILLRDITKLISEQFGFYHVGVFLMDDSREFAVLMAANSKGGKKMLTRNHKLKVGQVGIVGYVTSSGNPRIALDTDADAVHLDNPDLPDTRSELALPLQIGKQIIGALDIQSLESNAFSQDDVQILSTLADQIAIAIQNARSFEESRKLLHKAQSTVSGYMTESWQALRPIQKGLGYQFSGNSIKVLESPIEGAHIKDVLKKGVVIISGENSDNLAIPIRLREQVIGVMNLQNPAGQAWDQDQIDIATATAERLSLAIENATLLQTTQRRADIERVTTNISTRISSSTRYETILQTAAEELSRALGGSDVLVQIEPVSIKMDLST
jgi:GAF domain-containing protein